MVDSSGAINQDRRNPFDLPMLRQVFHELRHGYHISPSDGGLYLSLRNNFDSFRILTLRRAWFHAQVPSKRFLLFFRNRQP